MIYVLFKLFLISYVMKYFLEYFQQVPETIKIIVSIQVK